MPHSVKDWIPVVASVVTFLGLLIMFALGRRVTRGDKREADSLAFQTVFVGQAEALMKQQADALARSETKVEKAQAQVEEAMKAAAASQAAASDAQKQVAESLGREAAALARLAEAQEGLALESAARRQLQAEFDAYRASTSALMAKSDEMIERNARQIALLEAELRKVSDQGAALLGGALKLDPAGRDGPSGPPARTHPRRRRAELTETAPEGMTPEGADGGGAGAGA